MRYPEPLIAPMRRDLTQFGLEELRTPEDVDRLLQPGAGTVLIVTNSVCGCAAGKARPAVGMALRDSSNKPSKVATVFAGGDVEAVARLREHLKDFPPSSPSMALFQDGKPVYVMHRHQIEGSEAPQIARVLTEAFDRFCVTAKQ